MKKITLFLALLLFNFGALMAQSITNYAQPSDWKAHSGAAYVNLASSALTYSNNPFFELAFAPLSKGNCLSPVDNILAGDFGISPQPNGLFSSNSEYVWGRGGHTSSGGTNGPAIFKTLIDIPPGTYNSYKLKYAFGSNATGKARVYVNGTELTSFAPFSNYVYDQDQTIYANIKPWLRCGLNAVVVTVDMGAACGSAFFIGDIITTPISPPTSFPVSYTYNCLGEYFDLKVPGSSTVTGPNGYSQSGANHIIDANFYGPGVYTVVTRDLCGLIINSQTIVLTIPDIDVEINTVYHSDYCLDLTLNCDVYKLKEYTLDEYFPVGNYITEPGTYEERCYNENGCLSSVTTHNVVKLDPVYEYLELQSCDDNCYWYIPPYEGEYDYYHLTGISGPNNDQYNYNTTNGTIDNSGNHHIGWAAHCLLRGGSYNINYYNFDEDGNPTCLIKTVVVTVEDGSETGCTKEMEYTICAGACQTIGLDEELPGKYSWLDDPSIKTSTRTVCPTETTTYQLEYTNKGGCKCTVNITVYVFHSAFLPHLQNAEICEGEKYCMEFTNVMDDYLYNFTSNITYDFGDGTIRDFDLSNTAPDPVQCHFYAAPGSYTVSVTYNTPCGSYTTTAVVYVHESKITECEVEIPLHVFLEFGQSINLDDILKGVISDNCCPELVNFGTWYDNFDQKVDNPTWIDPNKLRVGLYKEYIYGNCNICRVFLIVEGESINAFRDNEDDSSQSENKISKAKKQVSSSIEATISANVLYSIAPNPSSGNFRIINSGKQASYDRVQIMSLDGKVISDVSDADATKFYDLSGNRSGIYFIEITSGDHKERLRLVLTN